ncbi:hypothetical protein [Caballeronia sp. DA-9]|uniref:hypothetical protein n=1 Tax=Caballeronia sp. DA-9 TaxID=3436237 RepID=UPI003F66A3DB
MTLQNRCARVLPGWQAGLLVVHDESDVDPLSIGTSLSEAGASVLRNQEPVVIANGMAGRRVDATPQCPREAIDRISSWPIAELRISNSGWALQSCGQLPRPTHIRPSTRLQRYGSFQSGTAIRAPFSGGKFSAFADVQETMWERQLPVGFLPFARR